MLYNIVSCYIKLSPDSAFASAVGPNQFIGMKILYRALPTPYLKVKAISSILNRASLAPCFLMGSDFPTIPASIRGMGARFAYGKADAPGNPGTGSELFEVNMWAMQFARVGKTQAPTILCSRSGGAEICSALHCSQTLCGTFSHLMCSKSKGSIARTPPSARLHARARHDAEAGEGA